MPSINDPDHYYNDPEKLAKRQNYVTKLRDYMLVGAVVLGGELGLGALGVIEAPTPDVANAFRIATAVCLSSAAFGEFTQRSMGNRLSELQQQQPEQPQ